MKFIQYLRCIKIKKTIILIKKRKLKEEKMKFTKGIILGSVITAGIIMMYADNNMDTKKIMKKGKQLMRKMGIM